MYHPPEIVVSFALLLFLFLFFFSSYNRGFTKLPFLLSPLSLPFVLSLRLCIYPPLARALSSRFNLAPSKLYQMAPIAFRTMYLSLALIALPQVLAGPACAQSHYGKPGCSELCSKGWGGGGYSMGAFASLICQGDW